MPGESRGLAFQSMLVRPTCLMISPDLLISLKLLQSAVQYAEQNWLILWYSLLNGFGYSWKCGWTLWYNKDRRHIDSCHSLNLCKNQSVFTAIFSPRSPTPRPWQTLRALSVVTFPRTAEILCSLVWSQRKPSLGNIIMMLLIQSVNIFTKSKHQLCQQLPIYCYLKSHALFPLGSNV